MNAPAKLPRGRPAGELTPLRAAVLRHAMRAVRRNQPVRAKLIAEACGLCDAASARRILRDLRRLGLLAI